MIKMSGTFIKNVIVTAVLAVSASVVSFGQAYGSYSPYTVYGVGDIPMPGSAYNRSMAGVGIAGRNNRFINTLNPAAVTARDSLAFMIDCSLYMDNKLFKCGDIKSASNTFNINDLVLSFPIYRSSAMMIGISPYSDTGFGYGYNVLDSEIIARTGNITYTASGSGSLYQIFAAAGVTFWKRLSLGVEGFYNFGRIEKTFYETFTDASYNGANNGYNIQINGFSGKVGIQYEQPIGTKVVVGVGATYRTSSKMTGNIESYRFSTGTAASDTLNYKNFNPDNLYLASEKGVGVSFKYADKLMFEFNYSRSDWSDCGLDATEGIYANVKSSDNTSAFKSTLAESYRLGMEYTPNRNDIRYYLKRVSYRAGGYYKKEYFKIDGFNVNAYGITLGATFPVFRWYNGITVGVDMGKRGSVKNNLTRENYFNFSVGFNLFDIWFQKPHYE